MYVYAVLAKTRHVTLSMCHEGCSSGLWHVNSLVKGMNSSNADMKLAELVNWNSELLSSFHYFWPVEMFPC